MLADCILQRVAGELIHELTENNAADLFLDAQFGRIEVHIVAHIHHAVGEDADLLAVDDDVHHHDTGFVDLAGLFAGDDLTLFGDELESS